MTPALETPTFATPRVAARRLPDGRVLLRSTEPVAEHSVSVVHDCIEKFLPRRGLPIPDSIDGLLEHTADHFGDAKSRSNLDQLGPGMSDQGVMSRRSPQPSTCPPATLRMVRVTTSSVAMRCAAANRCEVPEFHACRSAGNQHRAPTQPGDRQRPAQLAGQGFDADVGAVAFPVRNPEQPRGAAPPGPAPPARQLATPAPAST